MEKQAQVRREARWREDFPIDWERDHYITRREMAKFLTLGSALLAGMSTAIAVVARWFGRAPAGGAAVLVGRASSIPTGGSVLFRYPTEEDPCILVRGSDGVLRAFSQVCTHLSCAVVHRPAEGGLFCPCHHGWFDAASGIPTAGPPTRRLPRIRLEVVGDGVYAVGKEV
ncbi:MAG TPA: Rieske 2Fe-2S domain-containing protein [Myxococcota bacterium]|jgi:Rieske Fe-S protein|nr:Rieske 2Fe-2S domain-containing protein [Myxococcota bacterium]